MRSCVVVSDSFKGSLESRQICDIARACAAEDLSGWRVHALPVADGGEGTVDSMLAACGGERVACTVSGPYGDPVPAAFGLLADTGSGSGATAVVETAQAAGLPLAQAAGRLDPLAASTYGVGELAAAALSRGARHVVVGLGGSATNDGGCGAAAALGVRFLDDRGRAFVPAGGTLRRIARIDASAARERLAGVRVTAMCDVDNPLAGPQGAAAVFAPQKGADARAVRELDAGLAHLVDVVERDAGVDIRDLPGAGAAGGMGGGLVAFLGADLRPGIECVLDAAGFDVMLRDADLVVTGEGRIDAQTLSGKVVAGVARRARRAGVPVVALAGAIDPALDAEALRDLGVTAAFPIVRGPMPLPDALADAPRLYRSTLAEVLRLAGMATRR